MSGLTQSFGTNETHSITPKPNPMPEDTSQQSKSVPSASTQQDRRKKQIRNHLQDTPQGPSSHSSVSHGKTKPTSTKDASAAKSKTNKNKKRREKRERRNEGRDRDLVKVKLKVVVRRLPPNLPEDIFWKAVSPWATRPEKGDHNQDSAGTGATNAGKQQSASQEESPESAQRNEEKPRSDHRDSHSPPSTLDSGYFVAGKLKDGSRRGVPADATEAAHVYSRAYLRFRDAQSLVNFHQAFDGHLFRDVKGNEYMAVVEFAPFQRMPSDTVGRKHVDPLLNTIEEDADYKQFVTSLEAKETQEGQSRAERTDAQLLAHLTARTETSEADKAKHTPLLEHLRAQRAAKAEAQRARNKKNLDAKNASKKADAANKGKQAKQGGKEEKGGKTGKKASGATQPPQAPASAVQASKGAEGKPKKKDRKRGKGGQGPANSGGDSSAAVAILQRTSSPKESSVPKSAKKAEANQFHGPKKPRPPMNEN